MATQVIQEINKALSISTKLSISFHPQMDGQTEIVNKEVIVITPDKIRMTILIMDEGDSLEKKIFNATCLLSEADIQRLCKKNAICEECNGMLYDNLGRLYVPKSNLL